MPPKRGSIHRHGALAEAQTQAILRLAGKPVRVTGQTAPSDLEKLALLAEHVQRLKYPGWNPYRSNFARFHSELCWTRDEARGRIQPIPDYQYLREVEDAVLRHTPLLIDKSRRQLITWTMLAFDLWLIGGGFDERWPEIMPTPNNPNGQYRKVILAARKLEDENGSADFLSRLQFMYEQFEERGGREKWPDFPEIRFRYAQAKASNGGIISAVPQGKDQLAGSGVTLIHAEEYSRWTEQRSSLASALQTLQGGGHICLVCTAQAGTHAANIVLDKIKRQ